MKKKILLVTIICIVLSGYYIWFHSYGLFPNKNEVEKIILTFEPTVTLNNKKTVELDTEEKIEGFYKALKENGIYLGSKDYAGGYSVNIVYVLKDKTREEYKVYIFGKVAVCNSWHRLIVNENWFKSIRE